jgi:hypothetical protein
MTSANRKQTSDSEPTMPEACKVRLNENSKTIKNQNIRKI